MAKLYKTKSVGCGKYLLFQMNLVGTQSEKSLTTGHLQQYSEAGKQWIYHMFPRPKWQAI
jgi:hypothetical protein